MWVHTKGEYNLKKQLPSPGTSKITCGACRCCMTKHGSFATLCQFRNQFLTVNRTFVCTHAPTNVYQPNHKKIKYQKNKLNGISIETVLLIELRAEAYGLTLQSPACGKAPIQLSNTARCDFGRLFRPKVNPQTKDMHVYKQATRHTTFFSQTANRHGRSRKKHTC